MPRDWVTGLSLALILVLLQVFAYYRIGLVSAPAWDISFPLVAGCVLLSCCSPVLFLSCMHCLTSFDHVEDQLDGVSRRFDRLERLVS
ncbi:unnamed protein product, partial [Effrenium voratum]